MIWWLMWLIDYVTVLFAMCVDNLFWITSDAVDAANFAKLNFGGKCWYCLTQRILPVLGAWRDECPAVITSFILMLVQKGLHI